MKFKNPVLNNKITNKVAKGMVDGILNVVKRIAGQAELVTFDEVYEFVLNMDPDEFAAYQIPSHNPDDLYAERNACLKNAANAKSVEDRLYYIEQADEIDRKLSSEGE